MMDARFIPMFAPVDRDETEGERWLRFTGWNRDKSLNQSWLALLGHFAPAEKHSTAAAIWFDLLTQAYSAPGRHYHNLDHVQNLLAWGPSSNNMFESTDQFLAFQLAAWFHDAVYDTHQPDNEERSADLLDTAASHLLLPAEIVSLARKMILATKTHDPAVVEAAMFCDADLSILGSPPAVYDDYRKKIRLEYEWVGDRPYREGRSRVLRSFIGRERIFQTPQMRLLFEIAAVRNLAGELLDLVYPAPADSTRRV